MLLYVALIAILNLCLGYVLGVYVGALPGIRRSAGLGYSSAGTSLSGLVGTDEYSTSPSGTAADLFPDDRAKPKEIEDAFGISAARDSLSESELKEITAATSADPAADSEWQDAEVTSATAVDAGEVDADAATLAESVNLDEYLSGLDSFQSRLAGIDQQLQGAEDDGATLQQCVVEMTQASDDYLNQAGQAVQQLSPIEEDPAPVADEKRQLKQTISDQSDRVKSQRDAIQAIDVQENVAESKLALQDASTEMSDASAQLHDDLQRIFAEAQKQFANQEAAADSPDTPPAENMTDLATRQWADEELNRLLDNQPSAGPVFFSLLDLDHAEVINADHGRMVGDRVIIGLAQMIQQSIATHQQAARFSGQQFLLILPGETDDSATRLVEGIRQRSEATRFMADGKAIKATVSAAVCGIHPDLDRETLLAQLDEALRESKRYGRNRTFWHDGTSPEPTVPADLAIQVHEVEV